MRNLFLFVQDGCTECEQAIKHLKETKEKFTIINCKDHSSVVKYRVEIVPTLVRSNEENGDEVYTKLECFTKEELEEFLRN